MHRRQTFNSPYDFKIPHHDRDACYLEGCMADTLANHIVLLFDADSCALHVYVILEQYNVISCDR